MLRRDCVTRCYLVKQRQTVSMGLNTPKLAVYSNVAATHTSTTDS